MGKIGPYFILGILFVGPSGYGLYRLFTETEPYLLQRWLMYLFLFFFVCGLMLPFFALLNRYFFTSKRLNSKAVLRESIGCGILVDLLIWFRIGRVLSSAIVFICVGGFLVVEILIRARETVEFRSELDGD